MRGAERKVTEEGFGFGSWTGVRRGDEFGDGGGEGARGGSGLISDRIFAIQDHTSTTSQP